VLKDLKLKKLKRIKRVYKVLFERKKFKRESFQFAYSYLLNSAYLSRSMLNYSINQFHFISNQSKQPYNARTRINQTKH